MERRALHALCEPLGDDCFISGLGSHPNIEVAEGLHGALLIGPCHPVAASTGDWNRTLSTFEIDLKRDDTLLDHGRSTNVPDGPVSARHHLVDILVCEQVNPPLAAGETVTAGTLASALLVPARLTAELRWCPKILRPKNV